MPRKPHKSTAYLAFVRKQRCCGCGAPGPGDAHHFDERGIGQKCDDLHTSPLCRKCHRHFHDKGLLPNSPSREETARTLYRAQARSLVMWMRGGAEDVTTVEEVF